MNDAIILLFFLPGLLVLIDFIKYLIKGKRLFNSVLTKILEAVVIIGLPVLYIAIFDFQIPNDCCSESATFSPDHRLTIYFLITICIVAFFYSTNRKQIAPPLVEITTNCLLLAAIILNIFVAFQVELLIPLALFGNLPIVLLFIIALIENQNTIIELAGHNKFNSTNLISNLAWKILTLGPFYKYPVLIFLCLPLIFTLSALLLLFGQKPDSAIRAFTDTYKHGLSQLDYMCENVQCGGHYLCSVAANGHNKVVKPKRLGMRKGSFIICNRQLLISNAFEELLEVHLPVGHKVIRRNYNKVGAVIHKHYHVFENKYLSDFIYLLMKPFELFFLVTLYVFDRNPENRIAQQYLKKKEREEIERRIVS